jgi:hypothetical protein
MRKIPPTLLTIYLITICIIGAYRYGPLPGSNEPNLDMYVKQILHNKEIEDYLYQIPEDISIAATNNVGSHLSNHKNIYVLPNGMEKADIVILLSTDKSTLNSEKKLIEKLKQNNNYYQDKQIDEFIAFKKIKTSK